jgi:DNA-binding MarR family transcriptional regulator
MGKELARVEENLKRSFGKLREEMDDHLETINQNTTETQALNERLELLERKIDALLERVDELSLRQHASMTAIAPLSSREQEVFLLLYASDIPLSVGDLADRLDLTEHAIRRSVESLLQKGVPLLRSTGRNNASLLSLELRFKEAHARHGLVKIDDMVARQLFPDE